MNKLLLFGGIGAGLWLTGRAKAIKETVQYLEYTPGSVAFKLQGIVPVLTVGLNIYNPNKTAVPMNGILGQISYKGRMVASFTNSSKVNIDGNETTSVSMDVRLKLFDAALALFTKDSSRVVEINGLIKTSFTDVPWAYSYDFASKQATKQDPAVHGIGKSKFFGKLLKNMAPLPVRLLLLKKKKGQPKEKGALLTALAPAPFRLAKSLFGKKKKKAAVNFVNAFDPSTFNQLTRTA